MIQLTDPPDDDRDGRNPDVMALFDVQQVAKLLNCSSRHVRRLCDSGRMPRPVRLGALIRWERKAIEQWIANGCPKMRAMQRGGKR